MERFDYLQTSVAALYFVKLSLQAIDCKFQSLYMLLADRLPFLSN